MSTDRRAFLQGFLLGVSVCLVLNLLAAHMRSDCGILAVLGRSACADDIRRAGFPLQFWEEGGFAYRRTFDQAALLLDLGAGLALAAAGGLLRQWQVRGTARQPSS
jgi:hypothetical protein